LFALVVVEDKYAKAHEATALTVSCAGRVNDTAHTHTAHTHLAEAPVGLVSPTVISTSNIFRY
jgi:hypothetical protein